MSVIQTWKCSICFTWDILSLLYKASFKEAAPEPSMVQGGFSWSLRGTTTKKVKTLKLLQVKDLNSALKKSKQLTISIRSACVCQIFYYLIWQFPAQRHRMLAQNLIFLTPQQVLHWTSCIAQNQTFSSPLLEKKIPVVPHRLTLKKQKLISTEVQNRH